MTDSQDWENKNEKISSPNPKFFFYFLPPFSDTHIDF